ncbi:MAG: hypothetical protein IKG52_11705 [Rhodobacteraceae bacterium]|nr:hypothetical protein [Paracoccaceae bacterium]
MFTRMCGAGNTLAGLPQTLSLADFFHFSLTDAIHYFPAAARSDIPAAGRTFIFTTLQVVIRPCLNGSDMKKPLYIAFIHEFLEQAHRHLDFIHAGL